MRRVVGFLDRLSSLFHKGGIGTRSEELLSPAVLRRVEDALGVRIRTPSLFAEALIHRSFLQKLPRTTHSNERLEFLGDAVLSLIIAEYLYLRFPDAEEGELTKTRSRLVNRKALSAYGKALQISDFILLSPSAAQSVDKGGDAIVADAVEAIIAALYLDSGFEAARAFVLRLVTNALEQRAVLITDDNYKSLLLEYAQSHGLGIPRYIIVNQEGPDHERTFTIEVLLDNIRQGSGSGKNKKNAEQAAAYQAFLHLGGSPKE